MFISYRYTSYWLYNW